MMSNFTVTSTVGGGLPIEAASNARLYLGTSTFWFYPKQWTNPNDWTTINNTSGTNVVVSDSLDAVNGLGGARRLSTGTSTDGYSRMAMPDFSVLVPTISYNDRTKSFYRMARARLITTPDADTILRLGSFNWAMGVIGTGSTTKYCLRLANGTAYIVSTISIDTGWHVFNTLYRWDGVSGNAWFWVDSEAPIGIPASGLWPLSASQSFAEVSMLKVGGAVSQQADVSFIAYAGILP